MMKPRVRFAVYMMVYVKIPGEFIGDGNSKVRMAVSLLQDVVTYEITFV